MTKRDPLKVKEYNKMNYERDKDNILAKQKEYRETNKETIAEKKKHPNVVAKTKEPVWCIDCKIFIQKKSFARHIKSKTHQKTVNLEII